MLTPAVIIIGRYQPPHLGHYAIFDMAKKFASDNPEVYQNPIVVVIDGEKSSKDKSVNPLTPEERIDIMRSSKKAANVKYLIAKDVIDAFGKLKEAGFNPIAVATGSDRGDSYVKMLDKYYDEPVKRKSLVLKRSELDVKDATIDSILDNFDTDTPVEFISGTLIRATVKRGDFDKFKIMVGIDSDSMAKDVFQKLKKSLGD